ncbi:LacI family DNA-binding transcriptional regulator [Caballeronia ptereochthonis]|uniref:LacI family transcription regulator n=1 Tax=Caballeronia ptereochthonis TaxID=1777144 RepID=A0A158B854_9BURK|nr:LacI family DNA-binding transcriptional regulator [Caballeronia ptereochthonis]SAK66080.1 LacI family transcription regulator [Caballeronia ptereochthonis]
MGVSNDSAGDAAASPQTESEMLASANAALTAQPLLADVARLAGVSTATVSRFLNEPAKVTEQTRAKVQAAITQLDWVPNAAARSLVSRRSYAVGAIVPTLQHEKFHQQLQAFQARLGVEGLAVFVACSSYDPMEGYRQARGMIARGVDALALLGDDYPDALFELLEAKGIPYVITFGRRADSQRPCVGFEHTRAYELMTLRLLQLGHSRFGVIFQSQKDNSRVEARLKAITDTLARNGLAVRPQHLAVMADNATSRIPFARAAFQRMMNADPAPTAIICGNDALAIAALLEAKEMGLEVPGAVSISGFDDIELAAHFQPALTTIRVPDRQMGELAAEYLIDRIAGKAAECPPMLDVSIIERDSTGPAPA